MLKIKAERVIYVSVRRIFGTLWEGYGRLNFTDLRPQIELQVKLFVEIVC